MRIGSRGGSNEVEVGDSKVDFNPSFQSEAPAQAQAKARSRTSAPAATQSVPLVDERGAIVLTGNGKVMVESGNSFKMPMPMPQRGKVSELILLIICYVRGLILVGNQRSQSAIFYSRTEGTSCKSDLPKIQERIKAIHVYQTST